MHKVVEDFAGPGGVDEGARLIGSTARIIGREKNQDAIDTARAAGHERILCDVLHALPLAKIDGYWNSSPCQTFSLAGNGAGRAAMESLIRAARLVAEGAHPVDAVADVCDEKLDERSVLALHGLRVIRESRPEWVGMENVPQALPLFLVYKELLEERGYVVRCEVLNAEEYGVPQTRKRAILIAVKSEHLIDGEVPWPVKTHSRFHVKSPTRIDEGYPRWVSMAEALTWGMTQRPYPAVAVGTEAGGTDPQCIGGSGARAAIRSQFELGAWIHKNRDDSPERWADPWIPDFNDQSGTAYDPDWPSKRPATVVAGRGLVQNPGATANRHNGSTKSRNDGVRVSIAEAGILQSFRPDYPWRGSKSSQYQRCGDAVPPLLAAAILHPILSLFGAIALEDAA